MLEAEANWLGKRTESGARRISTFNGVTRRHRGGSDGLRAGWLLVWRRSTSEWRVIQQLYPDGHIDDLAAQVGNVLADVFGTELVCRTVEILRQLHADVVRAWLRAPVA